MSDIFLNTATFLSDFGSRPPVSAARKFRKFNVIIIRGFASRVLVRKLRVAKPNALKVNPFYYA